MRASGSILNRHAYCDVDAVPHLVAWIGMTARDVAFGFGLIHSDHRGFGHPSRAGGLTPGLGASDKLFQGMCRWTCPLATTRTPTRSPIGTDPAASAGRTGR